MSPLFDGWVPEEEYLRERKIGKRQAQRERANRTSPPFVKVGRQTYYSIAGFRADLASREIKPARLDRGRRRAA